MSCKQLNDTLLKCFNVGDELPERLAPTPGPSNKSQVRYTEIRKMLLEGKVPDPKLADGLFDDCERQAKDKLSKAGVKGSRLWASAMLTDTANAAQIKGCVPFAYAGKKRLDTGSIP